MDSKTTESHTGKLILLWPSLVSPGVSALFTMVLMNTIDLINFITKVPMKKKKFHLVTHSDCLNDLKEKSVYKYSQVTVINVICNTVREVKWAERGHSGSEYEKLKFCTIYDLLRSFERAEVDEALGSSNSIDRHTIDIIISEVEARIIAKRLDIFSRHSHIIKNCATTKLHGFPVDNISDFASCSSCKLVHENVFLLQCGHQHCQICMNIKNRCETCPGIMLQGRVISNQNSPARCSRCTWKQPWEHYEGHIRKVHHELITSFIHNDQVDEKVFPQNFFGYNQTSSDPPTTISLNGTSIWEVSNVSDIKNDAVINKTKSVYSTPFYLFPHGYKMRLQLYLNGDSQARGTHMSLYVLLMRGDYDAYLKWPFHFKVRFTLLDQIQHNNQSRVFWSNTASICFKQPSTTMNPAYGISQCFPLDKLEQNENGFVRNDILLIKVEVDFLAVKPEISFGDDGNELINYVEQDDATCDDISAMTCQ